MALGISIPGSVLLIRLRQMQNMQLVRLIYEEMLGLISEEQKRVSCFDSNTLVLLVLLKIEKQMETIN